ncbi:MAG: hypothetical protein LBS56_10780 [Propionibacteriaceae bacterium]|jgi:MinD-like ATPase involved in chromosome partitioning or flagellar assembly|nr:hypothetical protein [Propionibacteriaceae bacterium]
MAETGSPTIVVADVPMWPIGRIVIGPTHHAVVTVANRIEELDAPNAVDARNQAAAQVAATAARLGRPIRTATLTPDGPWPIVVCPDGAILDDDSPHAATIDRRKLSDAEQAAITPSAPADGGGPSPLVTPPTAPPVAQTANSPGHGWPGPAGQAVPPPAAGPDAPEPPLARKAQPPPPSPAPPPVAPPPVAPRPLAPPSPAPPPVEEPVLRSGQAPWATPADPSPARLGWRGAANILFGWRLKPAPYERDWRHDDAVAGRHTPGTKIIAVVNYKGGVSKTVTSALPAATTARAGAGAVVACDINPLHGGLGSRTVADQHDRTIADIVFDAQLLRRSSMGAIASYTHHQPTDRYDVVWSWPDDDSLDSLTGGDVDNALTVLRRYYRLIVLDTGNNVVSGHWTAGVNLADHIVVPCTGSVESANAADAMLRVFAGHASEHYRALAARATVVVSQLSPDMDELQGVQRNETTFINEWGNRGVQVAMIPFDPALRAGPIQVDLLSPATRRAWSHAAALIMGALT